MPQRSETQFKIVMVGDDSGVVWQPGENRCLRLYDEDCSTGAVLLYVPWDAFDNDRSVNGILMGDADHPRLQMRERERQGQAEGNGAAAYRGGTEGGQQKQQGSASPLQVSSRCQRNLAGNRSHR